MNSSEVIEFEGWKQGMGSSLAYACSQIFAENKCDGILITLSDLPLVTNYDYQKMLDLFENESDIIATKSNNSLGVPAIYGSAYFNELLQVKGETAAKPIIYNHLGKVKVFENERAGIDIDTLDDFSQII